MLCALIPCALFAQQGIRALDAPEDEDDLNRELWEFARHTPYDEILKYVREAQAQSRASITSEIELPTGWRIAPAGKQVEVGHLPFEVVSFSGKLVVLNTGYYLKEKDPQEISIVDIPSSQVVKTVKVPSLFPSAVVSNDGNLYVSGGFDQKVYPLNQNFEIDREFAVNGFAGGLAFVGDNRLAIAYMASKNARGNYMTGKLALLNTATGAIEREIGLGYFPFALRFQSGKLFVTLIGENRLLVLTPRLDLVKTIDVGRSPIQLCGDGANVYVVNSNSDSLSMVDVRRNRVTRTVSVAKPTARFGAAPTSCFAERDRLYVTLAGANAVAVLNRKNYRTIGFVPAGWFPTKVLASDRQLFILSAKGIRGRRPNPTNPQPNVSSSDREGFVLTLLKGSLSIVNKPDLAQQRSNWTRQVESSRPIFTSSMTSQPPIKHVFLIIKENRTYDQVLGDLGRGNGDPNLTLFGDEISPIQHQLAREFVTLDNFFVNGEVSLLGHAYTTAAYTSPFFQWLANMQYSSRWNGYGYATSPAVMAPIYLWNRLEEKKIDYRFYGEDHFLWNRIYQIVVDAFGENSELAKKCYARSLDVRSRYADRAQDFYRLARDFYGRGGTPKDVLDLLADPKFVEPLSAIAAGDDSLGRALKDNPAFRRKIADCLSHYPFNFPTWDMATSDLERARAWKIDFEKQNADGNVPQFEYIWLPNDHTNGTSKRLLDPFQFVAQNDAALGVVISTIARSPVWKDSLILVVEDDAQNGPDHVDATRTIAFAAGPYVKRGAVVSDRYDQLSMIRTIELLFGLEPLNLGDRMAAPMFGVFTSTPNLTQFVPGRVSDKLVATDAAAYQQLSH